MTTIYLIRHGEVNNPHGILYGRLPHYGLSPRGKAQIAQTADFLKHKHIDAVYSSPLLRAHQTAKIIAAKLKVHKIYQSKPLLEVLTSFEGTPFAELSNDQSEVYNSPKRKKTDETIEDIAIRYHKFIEKLTVLHPDETFVIVGHGDPIMALRAMVQNLPLTLPSIRTNKHFTYVKHGEVLKIQIAEDGTTTIENAFQPTA